LKFAAIDIGSNGVRLLISRPLDLNSPTPEFKKVEFTRLPLRLGDDVFQSKTIGIKKADLLLKSMKAFSLLMEIYNVDAYRACATSAMRDAKNGVQLIDFIKKETNIQIETITGFDESNLILKSFLHLLHPEEEYMHIDVGGGSTEITKIKNQKPINSMSFNIGTVRLLENKVKDKEWNTLHKWLQTHFSSNEKPKVLGTGGNISKIYQLSNANNGKFISVKKVSEVVSMIKSKTHEERIYQLKLNPDRAEVIDYAGQIYLEIMGLVSAKELMSPDKGLKDGILMDVWQKYRLNATLTL
jgi:exopolyphosphatase / guanosine-5'-triphosphate,3'-diphosphate pyrophosphatase